MYRLLCCVVLLAFPWNLAFGQTLKHRPDASSPANNASTTSSPARPQLIPLTVPIGTPLKVDLDQEVRVRKVGQPVHGKTAEPVYAFDKLVVPAGTEVIGQISAIDRVSNSRR